VGQCKEVGRRWHMTVGGVKVVKGTDIHSATVTGDTIGDPFKDTSGPSLNILMKLMTMISLVFAKKQFYQLEAYDPDKWYFAVIIAAVFIVIAVSLTCWMRSQGFGKTPPELNVVTELETIKEKETEEERIPLNSEL